MRFEGSESESGRFLREGSGHGNGTEGWARAHASGPGRAHADGVGMHVASDHAKVGDELAKFAAVFDGERDVAGREGRPGGDARPTWRTSVMRARPSVKRMSPY